MERNYRQKCSIGWILCCLGLFFSTLHAEVIDVPLAKDYPSKYVVVKGDTLWDISGKFLQNPWQWPDIWQVNQQIENPHLIYPGDAISLFFENGRPTLKVTGRRPTYKLSPHMRIEKLDRAIPTIYLEQVSPFLTENRIVGTDTLENAPYIVGTSEGHLIAATDVRVYVKNISASNKHSRFGIYRAGKTFYNPHKRDEILGGEAVFLGEAHLVKYGHPSTFDIISSRAEILNGMRLLPLNDDEFNQNFMPKAAQISRRGTVLSQMTAGVRPDSQHTGANDVIIIDFGKRDGIVQGDVFNLYRKGKTIQDPVDYFSKVNLPHTLTGNALVFRVFDKVSYALVMDSKHEVLQGDIVLSPYVSQ